VIAAFIRIFEILPGFINLFLGAGLLLCVLSLICFLNDGKNIFKYRLWFLFLGSLSIGLFFIQIDPFLNLWDEQFHVLVGKHLIETPLHPRLLPSDLLPFDYQSWVENYTWLHKQPLALWQIALSMWLFGTNIIAARLPMVILHALMVYPIFRIGAIAYDKKVGYISAFLFTLLLYPLELVAGLHTAEHIDLSFMFYITVSIWCWFEWHKTKNNLWLILVGCFAGAAILTKWLVGLLVYAGFGVNVICFNNGLFRWRAWIPLVVALIITIIVFVPWQIYSAVSFPNEFAHEMAYNSLHFFEIIEKQGGDWLFYWHNLFTIYGLRPFWKWVLLLIVLSLFFKKDKPYPIFIGIVITTTYAFFSLASTKMPSFCIIVAPVLIIASIGQISTIFTSWSLERQNKKWYKAASFILLFGIGLTLFRPAQLLRNHYLDEGQLWLREKLITTYSFLENHSFPKDENVVLFTNNYFHQIHVQWIFHHGIHAYSEKPTQEILKHLQKNGFSLYEVQVKDGFHSIAIIKLPSF
jgi:4-amino-4-deoxy-L-arabinose transferase-like glycosyltransferase